MIADRPVCPACGVALKGTPSWFGLGERMPEYCPACGARLGYDLAGGIRLLPPLPPDSDPPSRSD
jgi:hypothetical protein